MFCKQSIRKRGIDAYLYPFCNICWMFLNKFDFKKYEKNQRHHKERETHE